MTGCDIITIACAYNHWCLNPFTYLCDKHWNENLIIICEQNYSSRHTYLKPPQKLIKRGAIPSNKFSDSLIWALQNTKNEYCILMLADYWLYSKVNTENITKSLNYMKSSKNILRVDIGDRPRPSGPMKSINDILIECATDRNCFLTTSLTPAIWNKRFWLDLLENGWTAWHTETKCHTKYLGSGYHSVWCEPGPIKYCNSMRGRDSCTIVMRREMFDETKNLIPGHIKVTFED
jgi:hypothetical protein